MFSSPFGGGLLFLCCRILWISRVLRSIKSCQLPIIMDIIHWKYITAKERAEERKGFLLYLFYLFLAHTDVRAVRLR